MLAVRLASAFSSKADKGAPACYFADPALHQRLPIELAALGLGPGCAQHDPLRRLERRQHGVAMAQHIVGADRDAGPKPL